MRCVVVNGSPRRDGNTACALDVVVQGITKVSPDALVQTFNLNEIGFRGCQGCLACKTEDAHRCMLDDGLAPLLDTINEADTLVIGSPIYMGHVSGQTKCFLDRMYGFMGPNRTLRLRPGKRAVVVITQGMEDESAYASVTELLERFFLRRGFSNVRTVVVPGTSGRNRGDIKFREEIYHRLYEAGESII